MNRKELLRETAKKHTELMEKQYKEEIKHSIDGTVLFQYKCQNQKLDRFNKLVTIELVDMDSVEAIMEYAEDDNKLAVLNFASYKHAGGGFITGSMAQEEALCHESFLYNVLKVRDDYYEWNRGNLNNSLYRNRALYTPDILFKKEDKEVFCDVITCLAPNKSAAIRNSGVSLVKNYTELLSRVDFILGMAVHQEVDTLVLGAYGCGVFGQAPKDVAETFLNSLMKKYGYSFKKVVFAIPTFGKYNQNYESFKDALKHVIYK